MSATQAEDPTAVRASQQISAPPFCLGLKKTGRVCLSGDKYEFSVKPSDGELLNQLVFLDSLLTQFPCPLLMVGLRMPTGYVLSGTNSPLLGWVCTVLEGSVDRV